MMYRTKVTVVTGGKEYPPGSALPAGISHVDLLFLKSKGFAEPVDMETDTETDGQEFVESKYSGFEGFHEQLPEAFKNPDEIRKIRSKKEVSSYAASVGLDLGEDYEEKNLKDLQEAVINFQDELEDMEDA